MADTCIVHRCQAAETCSAVHSVISQCGHNSDSLSSQFQSLYPKTGGGQASMARQVEKKSYKPIRFTSPVEVEFDTKPEKAAVAKDASCSSFEEQSVKKVYNSRRDLHRQKPAVNMRHEVDGKRVLLCPMEHYRQLVATNFGVLLKVLADDDNVSLFLANDVKDSSDVSI
eukprot:gene28609-37582_t